MAAVALIDIPTGRIEALGSAHTDCFRQEFDGTGRNARAMPRSPDARRATSRTGCSITRSSRMRCRARSSSPSWRRVFCAIRRYRKKIVAERVTADFIRLQDELKGSDSVAFLNRMFCADKGWTNCDRPRDIQQAAVLLGWDLGCLEPSFRCGRLNVLFGYPARRAYASDIARMPLGRLHRVRQAARRARIGEKVRRPPDDAQLFVRAGARRGVQPRRLLLGRRAQPRMAQVQARPARLSRVGRLGPGQRAHDGRGRGGNDGAPCGGRQWTGEPAAALPRRSNQRCAVRGRSSLPRISSVSPTRCASRSRRRTPRSSSRE